jgi:UPF0716 protein FxsA
VGRRLRTLVACWVLAEVVVYVLVAARIGVGWTILLTLASTAVGMSLLARQGTRAIGELRQATRTRPPSGRALGDAGLGAVGALLVVLPGFLGDLVGLCCLVPGLRALPRALVARALFGRLPDRLRGPVHVRSTRAGAVGGPTADGDPGRVIEGEVVGGEVVGGGVAGDQPHR